MILKPRQKADPTWKTITLADGGTFNIEVTPPSFSQRANDEGREVAALIDKQPDGWAKLRRGRICDCVTNWGDIFNESLDPIEFTTDRLLALCELPEVADQLRAICNEAFATPGKPKPSHSANRPEHSGEPETSPA